MNIIETNFKWNGDLSTRSSTKYIVLHHRVGNGDVQSIHNTHINNGWTGIGYNFYIRKDGSIYRGRPIDKSGAHATGYNSISVGICFEGNYDSTDKVMPSAQFKAGQDLIAYLKNMYPTATVVKHADLNYTACPGRYFPFDEIIQPPKQIITSANDITWALNHSFFPITDAKKFVKELDEAKNNNSSLYWGYYKLVNGVK